MTRIYIQTRALAAFGATAMTMIAGPAWAQQATSRTYDLPAQPLGGALRAVALLSGTNVIASTALLEDKVAPPLTGRYTVAEALTRLLQGSRLRFRSVGSSLVIEHDPSAAVVSNSGEIVVTGTRIRGAPVASPIIVLNTDRIRSSGQASLGEVVRSIPQSFGGGQQPGIGFNVPEASGSDVSGGSSINLRGIGADATLTLLNGRRVSYSGSRQSIDVSAIPLSIVDRIEIVPDGASAIYGSDAVAGVANIILKRDYRGIETRARLGASTDGGNFTQQYGVLGGTTWNHGGFALAYEFNRNTAITAKQRSYARDVTPGLTLFPAIRSHNVLLTGHQALGDTLTLSLDALHNRRDEYLEYPLDFGGDLAAMHGERAGSSRSYAIAPSLEWAARSGWRISVAGTIAADKVRFDSREFVGTDQYFRSAGCYCNKARSVELSGTGSLLALPAGKLSAALGTGYRSNTTAFSAGSGNAQNFTRGQDSYYAYAELNLPIVSQVMAVSGVDRLNLTGAVRYERYPGIGDVATPKFGAIYAPDDVFEFKASWGRSFRAPTLRQQFQPTGVVLFPAAVAGGTGYPAGSVVAIVDGGDPALRPERATSWSATLVVHPPALAGGRFELSYFDTNYRDRIVSPIDRQSQALSNPVYRDYVTFSPSVAQVADLVSSAPTFINVSGAPYDPAKVVAIANASRVNAGRQRFHGIDALAVYHWPLGGDGHALEMSANATYLTSNQQITPTLPITRLAGTVFNPPRFRARGSVGWYAGPLTVTADVSYIGGVVDNRATPRKRVAAMIPLDLTARYQTEGSGVTGGLDIVLGIQNLFNDAPDPIAGIFFEAPYDTTNYSPVGRYVSLSLAKKW